MRREDCILYSGGAPGAEGAFGAQAERYGIDEVNFTFEGHTLVRHRGLRVLNHEELLAGDVSLEYVARLMNRRYTEGPTRGLQRLLAIGAEKARKESDPTLERMYDAMGFVKSQNGRHFGAARPRGL